jgi:hypothetical protein
MGRSDAGVHFLLLLLRRYGMLALTGLVGEWHNPDVRSHAGAIGVAWEGSPAGGRA